MFQFLQLLQAKGLQIFEKKYFWINKLLTNRDFIEIDESKFNNLLKKTESKAYLLLVIQLKLLKN